MDAIEAQKDDEDGIDYEFEARQLIRAIFAFIEGLTFSIKIRAAYHGMRRGAGISDPERYFAGEISHALDEKGEIVERPAMINLSRNIRFAFALYEKAFNIPKQFDASAEWWSRLQRSIKVRDRLTHPRMPADVDVSIDEVIDALKAHEGFTNLLTTYMELEDATGPANSDSTKH